MARTKRRIYNTLETLNLTGLSPTVQTGYVPLWHQAPNSHQETFLRARAECEVTALVNAPGFDIPPENWWGQTYVWLSAFWLPVATAVHQPTAGTNVDYLGSVQLTPQRFPLETNAGEYIVIWKTAEPLIAQTARKSAITTVGPIVQFQLDFYDPQFVFSNAWADTVQNVFVRGFSLWEDP